MKKKFKLPKIEFTKVIVLIMTVFGIRWVEISYYLAGQGFDSNSEVTVAVVSVMLAVVYAAYMGKSYAEKNSRNKYDIEIDGAKKKKSKYSYEDLDDENRG